MRIMLQWYIFELRPLRPPGADIVDMLDPAGSLAADGTLANV